MSRQKLFESICRKQSFLCVGLDTDPKRIPDVLRNEPDPVFAFNKAIIDATAPFAVAFKPNTAFYEAEGLKGWSSLEKTMAYIKAQYPEILVIADAKRGDIGNTSASYARAFFEVMGADAITVSPYMGFDSVSPFLTYKDKWTILLAATSNSGSADFQQIADASGARLYERVVHKATQWASPDQLMFVVGATKPSELAGLRRLVPDYFFLVPGVGAQGGSMPEVVANAVNDQCGVLINASRSIIYASSGEDYARAAAGEAKRMQSEMALLLQQYGIC
ncbi:MAG TPA: orotidine-5'-phosphate decarboxylase [Bacteroidales bacterium]|nr:orotidine-5'-phosphate decarboxylase [Bacteroidales bacterium]